MLCADANIWIAYLAGEDARDMQIFELALRFDQVLMMPVILTELLSDPRLPPSDRAELLSIPAMQIRRGFWERAGDLRAQLIERGHRPKLGDTLIAQGCVDYDVPFLTRDKGFQPFVKHAGLILAR